MRFLLLVYGIQVWRVDMRFLPLVYGIQVWRVEMRFLPLVYEIQVLRVKMRFFTPSKYLYQITVAGNYPRIEWSRRFAPRPITKIPKSTN